MSDRHDRRRLLIAEAVANYAGTFQGEYWLPELRPILDEMVAEILPTWDDGFDFNLYPRLGEEVEKARLAAMTPEQRAEHDREEAEKNAAMEATFGPTLDRLLKKKKEEDGDETE